MQIKTVIMDVDMPIMDGIEVQNFNKFYEQGNTITGQNDAK